MGTTRAEPGGSQAPAVQAGRLLVFAIEAQEYALPLEPIVEIVPFRPPTPVPGAGPGIVGILPLRGRMVTVVDSRRCLGLPQRDEPRKAQVIVLREAGELLGLVVDTVARVAPAAPEAVEPLPAALHIDHPERFAGILRRGGGYVLLLDVAALLMRTER